MVLSRAGAFVEPAAFEAPGLSIREAPLAQILWLVGPTAPRAAGVPAKVGAIKAGEGFATVRTAPDRLFVLAEVAGSAKLPKGPSVHDVTDGWCRFLVEGPLAAELLAGATSVDLDARAFPPGTAVITELAKTRALIVRGGPEAFAVHVDVSLAAYAFEWLTTNGRLVVGAQAVAGR